MNKHELLPFNSNIKTSAELALILSQFIDGCTDNR